MNIFADFKNVAKAILLIFAFCRWLKPTVMAMCKNNFSRDDLIIPANQNNFG